MLVECAGLTPALCVSGWSYMASVNPSIWAISFVCANTTVRMNANINNTVKRLNLSIGIIKMAPSCLNTLVKPPSMHFGKVRELQN